MPRQKTNYWLFKEEPDAYSYEKLEQDKKTVWDGVKNNLALKNLRQVKKGDRVFFYHTGKEKAIVGEMRVISNPQADEDNEKVVVVEVEPVKKMNPVPLARIKADESLQDWDLVRISRLSIVPVTPAQWKRVLQMSKEAASS